MTAEEMRRKIDAVEDVMSELELADKDVRDEMILYLRNLHDDIGHFLMDYA